MGQILGGKLLEGKASSQPNNVSKHRNELFSKETLTNSCTVCHLITINMLKTSKLGLISWTKDKYVKTNGRVPNSTVNRHPGSE